MLKKKWSEFNFSCRIRPLFLDLFLISLGAFNCEAYEFLIDFYYFDIGIICFSLFRQFVVTDMMKPIAYQDFYPLHSTLSFTRFINKTFETQLYFISEKTWTDMTSVNVKSNRISHIIFIERGATLYTTMAKFLMCFATRICQCMLTIQS